MDRTVFSDQLVRKRLRDFDLIRADATGPAIPSACHPSTKYVMPVMATYSIVPNLRSRGTGSNLPHAHFDVLDYDSVIDHDDELPHPAGGKRQPTDAA